MRKIKNAKIQNNLHNAIACIFCCFHVLLYCYCYQLAHVLKGNPSNPKHSVFLHNFNAYLANL